LLTSIKILLTCQNAFAAGVDTTYITLNWAMAELIKNTDTMKKLQDEVRGIVKPNDILKLLTKIEYLKAVIKEILRLHPPAPLLVPRQSMEECEIEGFTIPKGTEVLINCWPIQRDPRSWEAPEQFKPERFIRSRVDYKGLPIHPVQCGKEDLSWSAVCYCYS
jgi:cytochrome P450